MEENLEREKSKEVIGTFNDLSFQISFIGDNSKLKSKLFSQLGYPCIPSVGIYGETFIPGTGFSKEIKKSFNFHKFCTKEILSCN